MSVHEGKRIQDMTLIERLRHALQPTGTASVVLLRPLHSCGIEMNADFVAECINELDRIPIRVALGEKISNLEKLAFELLLDSAYIDIKAEKEREEFLKKKA